MIYQEWEDFDYDEESLTEEEELEQMAMQEQVEAWDYIYEHRPELG